MDWRPVQGVLCLSAGDILDRLEPEGDAAGVENGLLGDWAD